MSKKKIFKVTFLIEGVMYERFVKEEQPSAAKRRVRKDLKDEEELIMGQDEFTCELMRVL